MDVGQWYRFLLKQQRRSLKLVRPYTRVRREIERDRESKERVVGHGAAGYVWSLSDVCVRL